MISPAFALFFILTNTPFSSARANAADLNTTTTECYPADTSGGRPAVSSPDCDFVLQQFLVAHNATPNHEIIITNNESEYANPSPANPYLQNGGTFFPEGQPVGSDNVTCQLVYTVSNYVQPSSPDTSITLSDFEQATSELIVNCTGTHGLGGEIGVTNAEGGQVYVNVQHSLGGV